MRLFPPIRLSALRGWMTLRDALKLAEERLRLTSSTPRLDAELLAAYALGIDRNSLLLRGLDQPAPECFWPLIDRRCAEEPVAYITGTQDFWTLTLSVNRHVLIPRPDSELLVEAAQQFFEDRAPRHILDLGTGSGALLLAALSVWPEAVGVGVDASRDALAVAQDNAKSCGFDARAQFRLGDWGEGLSGSFDLILCNPPYIAKDYPLARGVVDYEPHEALFAEADGLSDYQRLAPHIASLLSPMGCACIEIGYDQGETVPHIFQDQGLNGQVLRDLAGHDRCLLVRGHP